MQVEAIDKRTAPAEYQGDMDFRGRKRLLRFDRQPPDPEAAHEAWREWIDAEAGRLGIDLDDYRETEWTGTA